MENAQSIPGLKIQQRRAWTPEDVYSCARKKCFDTWITAPSMPRFNFVEIVPTCRGKRGEKLSYYLDRNFLLVPRKFGMEVTDPQDTYPFRVICAAETETVSWEVKSATQY